jgi:hypothetical protein
VALAVAALAQALPEAPAGRQPVTTLAIKNPESLASKRNSGIFHGSQLRHAALAVVGWRGKKGLLTTINVTDSEPLLPETRKLPNLEGPSAE